MPDYSAILRRSIDNLPENNAAMRQAVYDRARAALARQLTAVDPPLSADDLESQHQQLEDAIADIEDAVNRRDDPSLAGIDWEAIDNEFAEFETAAGGGGPSSRGARAERSAGARFSQDPGGRFDDDVDVQRQVRRAKPSRAPFYIFLILFLMVAGGAGAFAYTQWDMVKSVAQSILAETLTAKTDPGESSEPPRPFAADSQSETGLSAAVDDSAGKSEDRLGDSGAAAALDVGVSPGSGDDTVSPGGSNLVGQKAIFYEQGSDGAPGQAQEGAVAWTRVTQPDGSPAIEARLDIPQKGISAIVTISRNSDSALPASHLIEVNFGDAIGLTPAAIDRVPALVMKPNEQARGQALAGAAVPVTESMFWIALSADPDAEQRNLILMRDGAWFDMPILFKDGTRALITFEKGIPGDQVFETVMASWSPS